jgi:hypothetical protein
MLPLQWRVPEFTTMVPVNSMKTILLGFQLWIRTVRGTNWHPPRCLRCLFCLWKSNHLQIQVLQSPLRIFQCHKCTTYPTVPRPILNFRHCPPMSVVCGGNGQHRLLINVFWEPWRRKERILSRFLYSLFLIRIYLLYRGIHCENSE